MQKKSGKFQLRGEYNLFLESQLRKISDRKFDDINKAYYKIILCRRKALYNKVKRKIDTYLKINSRNI